MPQGTLPPADNSQPPLSSLREAHISLIVDILYHAIKDKRESALSDDGFADEDHKAICYSLGFRSGEEELAFFAKSDWFERLFEELEHTDMEYVRGILLDKLS
jgi:hypothetical protein